MSYQKLPIYFSLFVLLTMNGYVNGQQVKTLDFSQQKVFIENKGQFICTEAPDATILFADDGGPSKIYFTPTGLIYTFKKVTVKKDKNESNSIGEEEEEENSINSQSDAVKMEWVGCNPDCKIVAGGKTTDYYSYYIKENGEEKNMNELYGYKTLTYKDLYPGIDIQYVFNPKEGIEYSVIVHAGTDPRNMLKMKMKYEGKNPTIDRKGDVHIKTAFGDIIDHAPSRCLNGDNSKVSSEFKLKDDEVSFIVHNYNPDAELTIDPWTITPNFPNSGKIWNCQTDAAGNVYLYGGDSPLLLKKFNSTGTLQWTYTTPWDSSTYWLGTLITDRTGVSYITSGANGEISKITTAGALVWHNNPNGLLGPLYEYWHLAFNCDQTQLVVGGTELPSPFNIAGFRGEIFNINLTNGNILNQVVVGWTTGLTIKEVRTICSAPNGNFYWLTLDSIGSVTPALALNWKSISTYAFAYGSPNYTVTGNLGQNNIRTTLSNIYTQNGTNVHKRDITNGNILTTAAIPGGTSSSFLGTYSPGNSGLDIDSCGNVYVGSSNQVVEYDANLNQITTVATPSAVYDIAVNNNGEVIACGNGFAMSISFSACKPPAPICKLCSPPSTTQTTMGVLCYGGSTGSATITPSGSTPPYTYNWLPSGGSNSTASALSAGTYTCTVTDATGCSSNTLVIITQPAAITATITPTSASCGNNNGSASASATGGTGTLTYSWSPAGGSTSNATGLTSGTYTLTVTDANSCTSTFSTIVGSSGGPTAATTQGNILCFGNSTGTANANVSGGTSPYTYSWSPTGGNNATASNLSAGTYTCTFTDANGCTGSTTVTITQPLAITATITPTDAACGANNGAASVSASGGTGGYNYSWSPSGGTGSNTSGLSVGIYTVTITDANSCTYTASTTVNSIGGPTATPSQTNIPCYGNNSGTGTATVTGGTSPYHYSWSPSGGSSSTATGLSAGTYTCIVTDNAGCISSFIIVITQPTQLAVTYMSDTICSGSSKNFTGTTSGGTAPYTYSWSPTTGLSCNNCPSPTVTLTASTCYTVTVNDLNGCSATARTCTKVNLLPDVTLLKQSEDTVCNDAGIVKLFGSPNGGVYSGRGVYGSYFYPDSGLVNQFNLFYYTVTDTNGCAASATDSVYVKVCTGINNIAGNNGGISIYPNPNNGQFVMQSSVLNGQLTVEIYDVLGQIIIGKPLVKKMTLINMSNKANGVYLYRVFDKNGEAIGVGKFVLEK